MMISFENGMFLKNRTGKIFGEIKLCVEDGRGTRNLRLKKKLFTKGAFFSDEKWHIIVNCKETPSSFLRIKLNVSGRPGSGTLKRIFCKILPVRSHAGNIFSAGSLALFIGMGMNNQDGVFNLKGHKAQESSLLTLVYNPSSSTAFLTGIGSPTEDFSAFKVANNSIEAGFAPLGKLSATREYELVLATGNDPFKLLNSYGDILGKYARKNQEICTGWNSWDYYGGSLAMDDVRRELKAINNSPLKGKLKYCVIDMGWARAWGDWRLNRKFPSDFRTVVREIEKMGFVPGLWFAPLQCSIYTQLGRHRQDLFIKSPAGSPEMFKEGALLDFTLPEVQDILRDWFGAAHKAGFKLFKIDYIYKNYLMNMSLYSNPARGRAGVIRAGINAIRDAVGNDAHIMNCGAPAEAMLGLADSSRVSMDIHTFWGHIRHNASQIAIKLWQNGKLWTIDPDFALIRCRETTSDRFPNFIYPKQSLKKRGSHWMAGKEASYSELQTLLTLVRITGGNVFLSDSICRLNKKGIEALGKLFPPLEGETKALDLFSGYETAPRFWSSKSGSRNQLAVFNWDDKANPINVPRNINIPSRGRDVFSGKNIAITDKTLMPARSAFFLDI